MVFTSVGASAQPPDVVRTGMTASWARSRTTLKDSDDSPDSSTLAVSTSSNARAGGLERETERDGERDMERERGRLRGRQRRPLGPPRRICQRFQERCASHPLGRGLVVGEGCVGKRGLDLGGTVGKQRAGGERLRLLRSLFPFQKSASPPEQGSLSSGARAGGARAGGSRYAAECATRTRAAS